MDKHNAAAQTIIENIGAGTVDDVCGGHVPDLASGLVHRLPDLGGELGHRRE